MGNLDRTHNGCAVKQFTRNRLKKTQSDGLTAVLELSPSKSPAFAQGSSDGQGHVWRETCGAAMCGVTHLNAPVQRHD